jgi:hypothetical protein
MGENGPGEPAKEERKKKTGLRYWRGRAAAAVASSKQ